MHTGLTPERRAEIEAIEDRAERLCAALRFDVDGTHRAEIVAPGVTIMSLNNDLQALMQMLDDAERERDLLAETLSMRFRKGTHGGMKTPIARGDQ